ncbi:MAG: hypothetical protein PUC47_02680, partial [Oscillospiraceae bacterium]|nr:hypothetical protein [Oscillospiraceae bacterium]
MKNALLKETFREIRRSKNRFFSILAIIAVGCGFFAGVKSSCPDMKLTAERYFAEQQMYDLRLISTYGFNEDDLDAIRQDGDIRGMMPAYSTDVLVAEGDTSELTVRVLSCPTGEGEDQLNQSVLKEGRMPEKSGECVLGTNSLSSPLWELGAKVQLTSGTGDPLSDTLSAEEYEVVGYVQTPQFLSVTLGNTSVGDGKLDGYIFVPGEDFCLEVYTDVYLTLQSTDGLDPFTDAYTDAVDAAAKRFESVADIRTVERFEEIQTDAREELDDAKQQLADGEAELADGEAELADAREELDKGWADYKEAKEEFDSQIADAERQLADAERQLSDGETEYQSGLKEYEDGLAAYEAAKPDAEAQLEAYRAQAAELEAQLGEAAASMESGRQLLSGIDGILTGFAETSVPASMVPQEVQAVIGGSAGLHENLPALLTAYVTGSAREKAGAKAGIEAITGPAAVMLNESQAQYDEGVQGLAALKQGIADGEQQLADGKAGLDAAKEQLDAAREELDRGRTELSQNRRAFEDEKADGEQQLSDALAELEDGEAEYADGKAEFDEKYPDAVADIADAKEKIADGEAELADLEEPVWYVQTREDNSGCSSYGDDAEKVDAVAAVFPIFFVLVAALVCLTAMTRMVEEQRTQIGTLKALGYGRGAVMSKYILYAVTASVVGSALGLLIGFQLFPRVIINAYKSLYQLP